MARVVLDVNVLVSATIGRLGASRQLLESWRAARFTHCTSEHIIQHMRRRLALPRIRRYALPDVTPAYLEALLRTQAVVVPVLPADIVLVTGDPEDDAVLATARLTQADYLVTGDRGLLAVGTYEGIRILTPRAFAELLEQTSN
jgi:putative PIN family toxin of toxin-antitoxin system